MIQARARSERDVRSFLQSGLADEQIRVGALLQEIFQTALDVDWQSQKVRRAPAPLPVVGVVVNNLPLHERFLVKETGEQHSDIPDFNAHSTELDQMDEEFWQAYRALDREQLFNTTLAELKRHGKTVTLKDLAAALPPSHDLETLVYWLAMAREAGVAIGDEAEAIDLFSDEDGWIRFHVPQVQLSFTEVADLESGDIE